jgi:hypothetical protein
VGINPGWTPHVQKVPQKAVAKAKLLIESRQQKRVLNIGGTPATRGKLHIFVFVARRPLSTAPSFLLSQVKSFKRKLRIKKLRRKPLPPQKWSANLLLPLL